MIKGDGFIVFVKKMYEEICRDFVKTLFGPMIRNNSVTKDLKIMIWDSSRDSSRDFIDTVRFLGRINGQS